MKYLIIAITMALGNCVFAAEQPAQSPSVQLGLYDPDHAGSKLKNLTYEEVWLHWEHPQEVHALAAQLQAVVNKDRTPIIAIEPWNIPSIGGPQTLLTDVAAGKYDEVIISIANAIASVNQPVYVRWGSEMEFIGKSTKDYPWGTKPPAEYIAAFQHVTTLLRQHAPQTFTIWAPSGNEGLADYYPGSDFVDVIGISLFEVPAASTKWFGHPMTFDQWMQDMYPRIADFNKPVFVIEMGIYGTSKEQKKWMTDAFTAVANYPLVKAMVYYNAQDFHSWREWCSVNRPDWTIDTTIFR